MVKCNWHENIKDLLTQDAESSSLTARNFTVLKPDGCDESLEICEALCHVVSTCRTLELYSNAGYLKSVHGHQAQENHIYNEDYQLFEVIIESDISCDLVRAKFLSNSHVPKSEVYFLQLTILPKRQASRSTIDTFKVREMLKDLPHNQQRSASVLSMMDNMPPALMGMMCPQGNVADLLTKCGSSASNLNTVTLPVSSATGQETSDSRVDKIEVQQLELKEDINKLRSELTETRSTILQALADSEARILQRLSQISDEVKSFKT